MDIVQGIFDFGRTIYGGLNSVVDTLFNTSAAVQQEVDQEFSKNQGKTQIYNELAHHTEIFLNSNLSKDSQEYYINPAAVLNLTIEDCLVDWVTKGSITFLYFPNDVNVSGTTTGNAADTAIAGAAAQNTNTLKTYNFRGDGYDILRVYIYPLVTEGSLAPKGEEDYKWRLSYAFSIYDIEDVVNVPNLPKNLPLKCAKIYFKDVRAQILESVNLEYSTATSTNYTPNIQSGLDNEGTLKTGEAMLDILKKVFLEMTESGGNEEYIKESEQYWDTGQADLFYTSPAEYSAMDDLEYLYNHHISVNPLQGGANDLCLLHTKKTSTQSPGDVETLALTPISDFFKEAPSQIERFWVTKTSGRGEGEGAIEDGYKSPEGQEVESLKYGQIMQYSFVDMSPATNSTMFATSPVYSVNIMNRTFKTTFSNNDVESVRGAIADSYISQVQKEGSGSSLFLPTLHLSKRDLNVFPRYSINGDNDLILSKPGFHNLLYTGLFHNACICFKTLGLTVRKPGTFIGIEEPNGCSDTTFNNKVYGQWFVIKVDQVFEAGAYLNVIYAIKTHRYKAADGFSQTL